MLDAIPVSLSEVGTVKITDTGILVEGFNAPNGTCRDVAALAVLWAIGRLQDELRKTLERPGDNNICVG